MSKTVQWKRGNANVSSTYTGAQGEITVNTSDYSLNIHDGVTVGGFKIPNNTNSNISVGNLSFLDQTIRGTISNRNITISPSNANVIISSNVTNFANIGSIAYTANANYLSFSTNANAAADLRIVATNGVQEATIYLWANNRKMGFNTVTNAFDYNFNGILSATSFVASPNEPIGYSFYRPTPNLYSGMTHVNSSNAVPYSYIKIVHDGVDAIRFYDSNTTEMIGNLIVTPTLGIAQNFPSAYMQLYSNVDSYSQFIHQNNNSGPSASTDLVATADNGTDSTYYLDLGITSSQHADPDFFGDASSVNDAYLYVVATDQAGPSVGNVGNLILGSTNGFVKTFVGNTAEANVVTIVSPGLLRVFGNVTTNSSINANGAVLGTVSINGNLTVANVYVPTTASSAGTRGQFTWDENYFYVCIGTNTWRRANLSTW